MADMIIYQDRPDNWHYHAPTQEVRNHDGTRKKMMAYTGGVLYALDHEQGIRVDIPVSRWKLAGIGLGCVLAALKR